MRGDPGTSVKLTIVRPGRDKPFDVSVTRERIELRPVKWEIKDGIGYININTFSGNVADQTKAALVAIDKATGGHPLGYVVDLRSNPGGLLDQAVDVSDDFLEGGEIVSQRGRDKDDIERYYARPGDMAHGLPVIVLVDAGTASASEIVAGALQDHRRALIMGEKSFGKGSVQTVVQTGPDAALRLTTARYYTPSGRSVQAGGIEPDIAVPQLSDPDYKDRRVVREADLRRHLLAQAKVEDKLLEADDMPDPRFAAKPEELEKKGIKDFQLYYALNTLKRLAAPIAPTTSRRRRRRRSFARKRHERSDRRRPSIDRIDAGRRGAADRAAASRWPCSAARSARNISAGCTRARCATGSAGRTQLRSSSRCWPSPVPRSRPVRAS